MNRTEGEEKPSAVITRRKRLFILLSGILLSTFVILAGVGHAGYSSRVTVFGKVKAADIEEILKVSGSFDEDRWLAGGGSGLFVTNITSSDLWVYFTVSGSLDNLIKHINPCRLKAGQTLEIPLKINHHNDLALLCWKNQNEVFKGNITVKVFNNYTSCQYDDIKISAEKIYAAAVGKQHKKRPGLQAMAVHGEALSGPEETQLDEISSIADLYKLVNDSLQKEKELKLLKKENNALKSSVASLKGLVDSLRAKLEASLSNTPGNPGDKTVGRPDTGDGQQPEPTDTPGEPAPEDGDISPNPGDSAGTPVSGEEENGAQDNEESLGGSGDREAPTEEGASGGSSTETETPEDTEPATTGPEDAGQNDDEPVNPESSEEETSSDTSTEGYTEGGSAEENPEEAPEETPVGCDSTASQPEPGSGNNDTALDNSGDVTPDEALSGDGQQPEPTDTPGEPAPEDGDISPNPGDSAETPVSGEEENGAQDDEESLGGAGDREAPTEEGASGGSSTETETPEDTEPATTGPEDADQNDDEPVNPESSKEETSSDTSTEGNIEEGSAEENPTEASSNSDQTASQLELSPNDSNTVSENSDTITSNDSGDGKETPIILNY